METVNEQVQKHSLIALLIALLVGFFVGLVIFGWWLTPVNYIDGGPQNLSDRDLKIYAGALADAYATDANGDRIRYAFCWWDDDPNVATTAAIAKMQEFTATDPANAARYNTLINVLNQENCTAFRARLEGQPVDGVTAVPPVTAEDGGFLNSGLMNILGFLLVLVILAGVLFWALSRRRDQSTDDVANNVPPTTQTPPPSQSDPVSRVEPTESEPELLGSFQTTYKRGDDTYDKSYIIESPNGDFLGECGISISEASNAEGVRNVTAFEVWLFDKNDTHTVTKVLMSDAAYNDDGYRAKLATRGELVLAEAGGTVPLETESLIINAEITDLIYNRDVPPQNSVFELATIDLAAWVKTDAQPPAGGVAGDSGSADDMLSFSA
jgi:hypothetical protein